MSVNAPELRRVESVAARPGYRLIVALRDAPPMTVCLEADVRRGGVFGALADEAKFAQVRVADDGYLIEWPEPADDEGRPMIDIDADSLFALGEHARADHHAEGFVQRILRSLFGYASASS